MSKMRAKLKVTRVVLLEGAEILEMQAVYGNGEEDNTYSKYTPTAKLEMNITNENLRGTFKPGDSFYVDFTAVPPEPRP